jgi:hypothetical protein
MTGRTFLLLAAPLVVFVAGGGFGCSSPSSSSSPRREKIPAVEWSTHDDALRVLRDRAAAVKTVSATGTMTLRRPGGDSVRLDLAMVAQQPEQKLRLRAWKLGRAVFDLTLTPDGLWLLTPSDPSLRDKARSGGLGASRLARSWQTLAGGLFDQADLKIIETGVPLKIATTRSIPPTVCSVDRRTLTPRLYEVLDDKSGLVRFSLRLGDYRMVGGTPFPFRYDARSEEGDIRIDFDEVELNGELAPGAFIPPKRAEKVS